MSLKKWKVAVGNAAVMWAVIARVMVGHVVDGAAFREVVMDAETPRRHLHHRLGLVEHLLERGEVKLQPGVTMPGVAPHR